MKVVNQSVKIMDQINTKQIFEKLEKAGRTCYQSESKGNPKDFIKSIISRGHESVIEHVSITCKLIVDRGVSHEIVRHRIASYSQESTRYCNYSKDKFGQDITFIKPKFKTDTEYQLWYDACKIAEGFYFELLSEGSTPEEARSVLPNSLKTELIMTANLREWRHFLKLRTSKAAHPQMREVAMMLLKEFKYRIPVIFDDIEED